MKHSNYDYIIIGGGLSGLSMALQLHQNGSLNNKRLLILEQRTHYQQDKSWCGWNIFPHVFENCVSKTWDNWKVKVNHKTVVQKSKNFRYQYIPSMKFYQYCLDYITSHSEIELKLDCTVKSINNNHITTNNGNYIASIIYDARPLTINFADLKPEDNYLLQCFYGWKIKTKSKVFDPNLVTLMDFPTDQSLGINFMYVLPFSDTEALIEPTYFLHHTQIPSKEHFFELAKQYMAEHYQCNDFAILEEEKGILPMLQLQQKRDNSNLIKIGTAAGLLRPSTGYAFYGIQRYIQNMLKMPNKNPASYSKFSLWMDNIFLRVCRNHYNHAAEIFYALFNNTAAENVIRFMHDEAGLLDYFKIMLGMPKKIFIKAAIAQQLNLRSK